MVISIAVSDERETHAGWHGEREGGLLGSESPSFAMTKLTRSTVRVSASKGSAVRSFLIRCSAAHSPAAFYSSVACNSVACGFAICTQICRGPMSSIMQTRSHPQHIAQQNCIYIRSFCIQDIVYQHPPPSLATSTIRRNSNMRFSIVSVFFLLSIGVTAIYYDCEDGHKSCGVRYYSLR